MSNEETITTPTKPEMKTRRQMLGLLGAGAATAAVPKTAAGAPATPDRPNILFIYTDDHSYRTISAYEGAYSWAKTPNFDKLARSGVRFTAAYIGTWCMPSRATLLTGHHQFSVESMRMEGAYPGSTYDPDKCPFWPKYFREKGYVTAQIGKWHTGTDTGYGRDWDYQLVWNRPKHPETNQNYYYHQPITYQGGETKMLERYSTDQYTDWAIDFLKGNGRDKNKPFYLWLCYGAIHSPYQPAERHKSEYPGVDIDTPKDIFPPRPGKPDWAQKINMWEKDANGKPRSGKMNLQEWVRQYHQCVNALDENLKRIMDTLDQNGLRKNTLIIWTADQGLAFGQHGFRGVKIAPYDANIRSPMVISMPGRVAEGKVCHTPVMGADIVPTIFAFAGLKTPWPMQGRDLTPVLKNPDADLPHTALLVATGQKFGSDTAPIPKGDAVLHGGVPWYVLIRERRYKYVRPLVEDYEELYDLDKDPDELENLAMKKEHQATLRRLRGVAIAELKRNKAPFVNQMPPVKQAFPEA